MTNAAPRASVRAVAGSVSYRPMQPHTRPRTWLALTATLALRALANPALATALVRVAWRFRDRRWWRRFPFLPLPAKDYVRWRMHTAYGDDDAVPPAEDVVRYARWAVKEK